jgi:hypothetical protein
VTEHYILPVDKQYRLLHFIKNSSTYFEVELNVIPRGEKNVQLGRETLKKKTILGADTCITFTYKLIILLYF